MSAEYYSLGELCEATFVCRENRFRAEVLLDGQLVKVHVPNSGRMRELLVPGVKVWVQPAQNQKKTKTERKTAYTLVLVQQGEHFVCLHAHLANDIVAYWLQQNLLPEFKGCTNVEREKTFGASRMDFRIQRGEISCYAEVKSVNLLIGTTARFPDAPTTRGSKHLQELVACKKQGFDAAIIFLIMGNQAEQFAPNWETDPEFAQNLALAKANGVEIYVYTCKIDLQGVCYTGRIPMQEESEWKSMH